MKLLSLPVLLIALGGIAVAGGIFLETKRHVQVSPPAEITADAATAPGQSASTDATTPGSGDSMASNPSSVANASPASPATAQQPQPMENGGQRGQHMQQVFAQLGLSDAQKQQIDLIRQTVTDRRQRREEIMKILTPDQQTKFEQFRGQRGQRGNRPGAAPASAPATPTGA